MHTEIRGYKIQERIGLGGMGEVYKAFHPGLNRTAAVKMLFQKEHAERFKNEAYIQSSVNHPNIAKLYEYTVDADNTPCIIMEYVDGVSLDAYIHRSGRINSPDTEKILVQIVSALKYLHTKNIYHRDIKPQNFKVASDGTVKMLDFGISKSDYTPKLTQMGYVVGTTEYMAPEQFEHKGDKRSDIWSLGVMAYEMLTGHLPFESNNPLNLRHQIAKARFTDPKILVPEISDKLAELIGRSLRTSPVNRASAQDLEELLVGRKDVKNVPPLEQKKPPAEKKVSLPSINISVKPKWIIYGGILLVIVLVLVIAFSHGSPEPNIGGITSDTTGVVNNPPVPNPDHVKMSSVKIAVSNAPNVEVRLPDGTRKPVPIELTGKLGDSYDVILESDGYVDKTVHISFLPTQSIYTYNLDKKNEE